MEKWVMHGGQNKVAIEIACIPHAKVLKFLEDEQGDMHPVEWNKSKNLALQENIGEPIINNHVGHTWCNTIFYNLGF
jgi:hypothetical protein